MIRRLLKGVIRIFAVDQAAERLTADAIRMADQCFCGASMSVQIPLFIEKDVTDASAIAIVMRETWHNDHYHQMNKDGGSMIEKTNTSVEENKDERAAIGFAVPKT